MTVTIKHVMHCNKCTLVNFVSRSQPDLFYNVAVAFPCRFVDGERVPFDIDIMRESLYVGAECDVSFSKSLGSYVVRF